MEGNCHPKYCVYVCLLHGEQADEWLSLYESFLNYQCSAIIINSRPVSVHLHLLNPDVGAVLEEG